MGVRAARAEREAVNPASAAPGWRAILGRIAVAVAFFFALLQSVTVTAEWWRGARAMQVWDWLWVAALPALVAIYLRYFSVLRPECERCAPPGQDDPPRG
jgi:hypothetical protein